MPPAKKVTETDPNDDATQTPEMAPAVAQAPSASQELTSALRDVLGEVRQKKVTVAQYKARTPFNPNGERKKGRALRCVMYQNGTRLNPMMLKPEEIVLLNQLKPGKFVSGLVRVVERDNGSDTELHILYDNKTREQQMALKDAARNLVDILTQCVNGQ